MRSWPIIMRVSLLSLTHRQKLAPDSGVEHTYGGYAQCQKW
jgi:hypothetical protein